MPRISLTTPLTAEQIQTLRAGDSVSLNGVLYTARDAAHARLIQALRAGEELPFPLAGAVIYYTGPCPAKPGRWIGSAGPTTSGRMDAYTPLLLEHGLKGMVGKGQRSAAVVDEIRRQGAVYFATIGGAGALLAQRVKAARLIAYPDLGPEGIYELVVADFPAFVAVDAKGNDLYAQNGGVMDGTQ